MTTRARQPLANIISRAAPWTPALYVNHLVLNGWAVLDLNSIDLYCGSIENNGATVLLNGGTLAPVPEPVTLSLVALGELLILNRRSRHRTLYPDAQGRRVPTHPRAVEPPKDTFRSQRNHRLVQHRSSSLLARRTHARGSLPAYPSRLSPATIRPQTTPAGRLKLRLDASEGPRRTRCSPATRRGLSAGTQASADRHAQARGVALPHIRVPIR